MNKRCYDLIILVWGLGYVSVERVGIFGRIEMVSELSIEKTHIERKFIELLSRS